MILVLGKARSHRAPNLGCSGAESPGWFDVLPKNSAQDVMYEWGHCCDEAANHQLLIAVSMEECSSLMQNLVEVHCSTRSVILNAMATEYISSFNWVYRPHWLVQWSHHCSCMHIPGHSPWLPDCIKVTQTILIILAMAALFPDRPHHILFFILSLCSSIVTYGINFTSHVGFCFQYTDITLEKDSRSSETPFSHLHQRSDIYCNW